MRNKQKTIEILIYLFKNLLVEKVRRPFPGEKSKRLHPPGCRTGIGSGHHGSKRKSIENMTMVNQKVGQNELIVNSSGKRRKV